MWLYESWMKAHMQIQKVTILLKMSLWRGIHDIHSVASFALPSCQDYWMKMETKSYIITGDIKSTNKQRSFYIWFQVYWDNIFSNQWHKILYTSSPLTFPRVCETINKSSAEARPNKHTENQVNGANFTVIVWGTLNTTINSCKTIMA